MKIRNMAGLYFGISLPSVKAYRAHCLMKQPSPHMPEHCYQVLAQARALPVAVAVSELAGEAQNLSFL